MFIKGSAKLRNTKGEHEGKGKGFSAKVGQHQKIKPQLASDSKGTLGFSGKKGKGKK